MELTPVTTGVMKVNIKLRILLSSLAIFAIYFAISNSLLKAKISYAKDQIEVINTIKNNVKNKKDKTFIMESIKEIRNYYPSGTKQITGSNLDIIVEKEREEAVQYLLKIHNKLHNN